MSAETSLGLAGDQDGTSAKLIDRDNRGIGGITAEGERVAEEVGKVLDECAVAAARRLSMPKHKGRLVVAAGDSLVEYLFPAVLADPHFADWRTGKVRLSFVRFFQGKIVRQILKERVDVAVTWDGYGVPAMRTISTRSTGRRTPRSRCMYFFTRITR